MLRDVVALAYPGIAPFELSVLCEAFGLDRSDDGVPRLSFAVCSPERGPMPTTVPGFSIMADDDLDRLAEADLVGVPALPREAPLDPRVVEAVAAAHARGARILSVCSGAFVLGAAGLLDGRECTTHWKYTDELQRLHPTARVVPEVLYVDAGSVVTSAGTAAGLDACLHVWRQEFGSAVAAMVARRMVVPPQRDGGQAQFIARPVPDRAADTFAPLLAWIEEHLDDDLGVEVLARRAHMSPRTFARRFREEVGTTPHAWVTAARVRVAEEFLERSDLTIDLIASRVGFGTAAALRQHFTRARGVSPQAYRRQFAC
ncbi:helix-turn-helix domain-containing protein [Nocardioides fonticola]|uniref:Helix-turn-helix domain-containing protein n=1 Tax=Nocardioides fonticola TaxID=450363 RepID=A0ABP7Y125_9ACTN